MKISYNWLKQYLKISLPPEVAGNLLTNCGLEVEAIEKFESIKGGMEGLVVGEVITCVKHPNADKLSLTTVNTGTGELLHIVCGAPNVAAGQKVIVAPVGTIVHPVAGEPFEIKKSKIRGEVSEGMICAEDEIGLGSSHAGVIVLPGDTQLGMRARDFYKIEDDTIFEIGLTPNRADAASHLGVARDLAAVLNHINEADKKKDSPDAVPLSLQWPDVNTFQVHDNNLTVTVDVEDPIACPRYSGISIRGVKVTDSPAWLKNRLKAIGVGPINNIVDITNYVLHECGQPLHAFDVDKISGHRVVVRPAKSGEKFVTLDGVERKLLPNNLMICDANHPMCIAGVFGGMDSGIGPGTVNVFIESAYFNPASIRQTSRDHDLKTDASFRFERGTDPSITIYALKRAAMLMTEIAGGQISSAIVDVYPKEINPVELDFHYDFLDRFTGHHPDRSQVKNILTNLGFEILNKYESFLRLRCPLYKSDVTRPVDVIEEVLRVYGYNRIPIPAKLSASLPATDSGSPEEWKDKISAYLSSNGFNEIMTNSLTRTGIVNFTGNGQESVVRILNPISQDFDVLRQHLLTTGLEAIQYNRNRKKTDLRFFEFGKVYFKQNGGYREEHHLALYLTGKKSESGWTGDRGVVNFYFLKSFVNNIIARCGINANAIKTEAVQDAEITSGVRYSIGQDSLVKYGSVSKSSLRVMDINADVLYADFNWDAILRHMKKQPAQYSEISKFPQVRRDLSMLIDRQVKYESLEEIAYRTERKILKEIHLFDVYEGDKIEGNKKSYALSFILQDEHQTLTDKQIDKTMERIMAAFEKETGAVIRKN